MGIINFEDLTVEQKLEFLYKRVNELEYRIDQQNVSDVMDKIAVLESKIDQLLER